MLCRSQFFHPISSSHGYFRKVPCNPGSLSAPCSRHCVLSPAHCQTSAEPTFPCRASSKGHQSAKLALFSSLSHLKTFLCMSFSYDFKCLSLPGPEKENILRPGNSAAEPLQLLWVNITGVCRAQVASAALGRNWGGTWSHLVGPTGWLARAQRMKDVASHCGASLAI